MSSAPNAFLAELLALKKQQATEVFGPWDVEDEGRIDVKRVRPLLLSVFPEARDAAPFLTLSRVKAVYEGVTHRPWHAPASTACASAAAAATASPHTRRRQDPMYAGPTLDEVHRIIDALAAGKGEAPFASLSTPAVQKSGRSLLAAAGGRTKDQPLSLSASLSLRAASLLDGDDDLADRAEERSFVVNAVSVESCLRLLRGSMEQIYCAFCAASVKAGESVPALLPTDAAHLRRLSWNVAARQLRMGESYALQLLCATEGGAAGGLSCDAFVRLLCVL